MKLITNKEKRKSNSWKRIRKKFIYNKKKEFGEELKCELCNILIKKYSCKHLPDDALTVDHITPIAMGGDILSFDNLRLLCHKCNQKLGLSQWKKNDITNDNEISVWFK